MKDIDAFLTLLGDVTIADVTVFLMACGFLFMVYQKIAKFIDLKYQEHQRLEEEKKLEKQKLNDAWCITQEYPKYHQQSIEVRDALKKEIQEIRGSFEILMERLERMEENDRKRECSKLRDMLLQNYRYYTNEHQNPSRSWTRMESEAFWELYKEYEEAGGNGYMHSTVRPAMEELIIIEVGAHK